MVNTRKNNHSVQQEQDSGPIAMEDQTDLSDAVNMLREEIAVVKQAREKDAQELEALRKENAELRSLNRTWNPTTEHLNNEASSHHAPTTSRTHPPPMQLSAIPGQPSPRVTITPGSYKHPFTQSIMEATISDSWRNLPLEKYDGSSDPDDHLNAYLTQVTLLTTEDAALCRLFPIALKGRALSWFIKLPPGSINSFEELASLFAVQFATSRPYQLTALALANIRQEKKESLRSFMDRFNKTAMEIKNLNPVVAMDRLNTALKPGPFVNSLCKKPPLDMNDLRRRAEKYMKMEELTESRNQARAEAMPIEKQERI
ncbi:uncharacterized protein LOC109791668 [Cajanus cajan]|uniref:uncharacterized protein LOC109791668 n=1 Tax=Cajanus cajan TaxID=3821 RepID=UPI00098DA901|nr:uncharacterized protein LOC109791668 [Cajanus cajan]